MRVNSIRRKRWRSWRILMLLILKTQIKKVNFSRQRGDIRRPRRKVER